MAAALPAVAWPPFAPLLDPTPASADQIDAVLRALLTPNERRVLRLTYGVGARPCSAALIARRLGIRITTVHRLHARALRRLRAAAC